MTHELFPVRKLSPSPENELTHFLVVGGGVEPEPSRLRPLLNPFEQVIAADGGWRLTQRLKIPCHTLVGDFDTLTTEELEKADASGTVVKRYSPNKAKSDLEIALELAISEGASHISVVGALGGEWDHSILNLLAPLTLCLERGVSARLLTSTVQVYLVQESVEVKSVGKRVSLCALSREVSGLTLSGFRYALREGVLKRGQTLALANILEEEKGMVELSDGELFIILMQP